jgi:alpha,alpha-trehalase
MSASIASPAMSDDIQRRFPPHVLREYSLLADGYRGALCGPRGDIVWMCAPQWHDSAVFAALLGGDGVYAIRPDHPNVWGGHYEPRSLIWRNRWVTTRTIVECREALAYPGDPDYLVLLRRIEAGDQDVTMLVELDVRAGFGNHPMRQLALDAQGRWTACTGELSLRWTGAENATVDKGHALHAEITVPAGGRHDLVLELTPRCLRETPINPARAWKATETGWSAAVPGFTNTVAPGDSQHAYAVLRGMTAPGGGMAAAATMSLPERAQKGRNYDYRYSWVRDQSYAGIAAAAHGTYALLDDAVNFLSARVLQDGDQLAPAYTIDGGRVPGEKPLPLPGYPGGQTVVTGNKATRQFQLDCYGELLQLLASAARHDRLDGDGWRAIQIAVRAIGNLWNSPDAGLWELDNDWWTHSRLSCVAGLRTAAAVAPSTGDADAFATLADTILAETTRRCLHPDGHWQRAPRRPEPDAALVLPPVRGALPADDARTEATLEVVRTQLAQEGFLYRFPHAPQPLGEVEGAFLLCGFVMALADYQQNNIVQAFRWFERNRTSCGPPGLFTEEFDVQQRQLRGNLPQAFVHALLLECTAQFTENVRTSVHPGSPHP